MRDGFRWKLQRGSHFFPFRGLLARGWRVGIVAGLYRDLRNELRLGDSDRMLILASLFMCICLLASGSFLNSTGLGNVTLVSVSQCAFVTIS